MKIEITLNQESIEAIRSIFAPKEEPVKRKKAPVEDDEDEEPAPAKRKKAPVEDDEPAPAKRKKAPVEDDDDDEDDEPAPAKRKKAPVENDEEDEPKPVTLSSLRARTLRIAKEDKGNQIKINKKLVALGAGKIDQLKPAKFPQYNAFLDQLEDA